MIKKTLTTFEMNQSIMQRAWFLGVLAFSLSLFLFVSHAAAATIYFSPASVEVKKNEVFPVEIRIDAQSGEEVNAVAVGFVYSKDLLKVEEARDGGSIVNYWIERPNIETAGIVRLQGGITGGFKGEGGKIVTLYFRTLKSGSANISIDESTSVFLNDGKGTRQTPKLASLGVVVNGGTAVSGEMGEGPAYVDVGAPEIFDAVVSRSPDLFGNQYFLAFSARDGGSGIDYIEVKEGGLEYMRAESPYLLQNQKLDEDITIRAVDKVGNIKLETIKLTRSRWMEMAGLAVILLALGWFGWKKFKKQA